MPFFDITEINGSRIIIGVLPEFSRKELFEMLDYIKFDCSSCVVILVGGGR